ncbi:MAG TPA: hypothetical protein VG692_01980 [Gemmatimonadales bacterium]|nr:hypothetical protein [Gemmatimonadales bacterium]
MAPKALARTALLGLVLGLAACGGKKEEEPPAQVDLAAVRARRDSVRKAHAADSLARVAWSNCSDSVIAVLTKTAAGKKKVAAAPAGMIQPEVLTACGKPPEKGPAMAAKDSGAKADTGKTAVAVKPDTGKAAPAQAAPAQQPAAQAPAKPGLTPQQQQVMRADSIRQAKERAKADSLAALAARTREDSLRQARADSARSDSLKVARETEVLRETFTYAGGARDPFASLISEDKVGPEYSDLLLVGIYLDLRRANNSLAVLRDKTNQKRYKLRVGDRLGRLKVAQIRQTDVVFTVEDIGFERQETLSLRKREAETQ